MKNIQKYILTTIVVIAVIILLFLLKDWIRPALITSLGGYTEKKTVTRVDTVINKVDSIFPINKIVEIPVVVPSPYYDSSKLDSILRELKEQNKTEDLVDSLRYYTYTIDDSILKGDINTVTNTNGGKIVKQDFNYKAKVPIYIERTTVIEKNTIETLAKQKRSMFGVGLEASSISDYGINLYYKTHNNLLINGGIIKSTSPDRPDYIKLGVGILF